MNSFAEGTGDHQWIHCDPDAAARESPYGVTVAHGFFTLSLSPVLAQQIYSVKGLKLVLNYGLNRVRFPGPVKVGSRVRMRCELLEAKVTPHGVQVTTKNAFEVEGEEKPVCVAESGSAHVFRSERTRQATQTRRMREQGVTGSVRASISALVGGLLVAALCCAGGRR